MIDTDEALAEGHEMTAEEREHEELLYKRAVLEVVKELNRKHDLILQEMAMEASVDCA